MDRILVFEGGAVVEQGSQAELLARPSRGAAGCTPFNSRVSWRRPGHDGERSERNKKPWEETSGRNILPLVSFPLTCPVPEG